MGFLTGYELTWMPEALRILRDELPNIDVMVTSQYSPQLADGLSNGKIDAAFLRREKRLPDLGFRLLVKEPLLVILPSNHRLAALKLIDAKDLEGEIFVTVSKTAPVLRAVIDEYLKRSGANISPQHGSPRHGNVLNSVNGRRRTLTSLCAELSAAFGNESSSERRCTDCRTCSGLQKVEPVSCAKALALEAR
jgi:DNA-binding transcriptional LysR family regulator